MLDQAKHKPAISIHSKLATEEENTADKNEIDFIRPKLDEVLLPRLPTETSTHDHPHGRPDSGEYGKSPSDPIIQLSKPGGFADDSASGSDESGLQQTEVVSGVEIKVGDPQFTLTWNGPGDLDLHVVEPGENGEEIFYKHRQSKNNGHLDVDNIESDGPENIFWEVFNEAGLRKATGGPPGTYRWYVRYYSQPMSGPRAIRWQVRIRNQGSVYHFKGILNYSGMRSRIYQLKVTTP